MIDTEARVIECSRHVLTEIGEKNTDKATPSTPHPDTRLVASKIRAISIPQTTRSNREGSIFIRNILGCSHTMYATLKTDIAENTQSIANNQIDFLFPRG